MRTTSVLIVEDDVSIRERLGCIISNDPQFELLGSEPQLATGLAALMSFKPDVLLVDIGLPDGSGIELIKAINQNHLDTQALVISGFQDEHIVFNALEAGAQGYILKLEEQSNILESMHQLLQGGSPISPVIARLMLQRFKQPKVAVLPEALTEKQREILTLVSQGFSSKEISEKLSISYYTVTTHIKNIYGKLQVNSRTEAIFEAQKIGIL